MLLARLPDRTAGVATKSSATDLVLAADRAAEDAIAAILRREFPDDGIVGEEGASAESRSGRRWFVDPLDGTINYFYGIPHWAVAIACEDVDGLRVGVVCDGSRNELFAAARGGGAAVGRANLADRWIGRLTGRSGFEEYHDQATAIATTVCSDLSQALLATGFAYTASSRAEQARILSGVLPVVRDLRRFGSAQLDLAYVAAGRYDGYFESVDKPWDWKAGALLVREAGGRVSELPQARPGQPHIVASGPALHDDLVALLRRATS